jgi:hypothetical protein
MSHERDYLGLADREAIMDRSHLNDDHIISTPYESARIIEQWPITTLGVMDLRCVALHPVVGGVL